ncbi:hypothetical protein GF323_04385 [Candidatus Woesearchaeota archaeon]|nr:hypothetical protein [Candidatus Woesearchaeota archaeon]
MPWKKVSDFLNEHKWMLFYILLLTIVSFWPYITNTDNLMNSIGKQDVTNFHLPNNYLMRKSIFDYGQYPLWTENRLTEPVLAAEPEFGFPGLTTIINLMAPTVYAGFRLNMVFLFVLAALGVYFLTLKLKFSKSIAGLIVTVYMVNPFSSLAFYGYSYTAVSYAMLPFIILFGIQAVQSSHYPVFSALAAVCLALSFLGGGVSFFLYSFLLLSLYFLYFFLLKPSLKHFYKVSLILLLVLFFTGGLISIKLFISREYVALSNRSPEQGLTFDYNSFLGPEAFYIHDISTFSRFLITGDRKFPYNLDGGHGGIGFLAFGLLLLSFAMYRKKNALFFMIAFVFFVLLMMRSPVSYFFWKFVPVFNLQRNMYKVVLVYELIAAILAGYGAKYVLAATDKYRISKYIPFALIIIVILEAGFLVPVSEILSGRLTNKPMDTMWLGRNYDAVDALESSEMMQYLSRQEGIFRIKNHDENRPYGFEMDFWTAPLELQNIWGRNNLWNTEYVQYPMIAESSNKRARLYGILNVKYLFSQEQINISGFHLIRKFEINMQNLKYKHDASAYGPYLYENSEFLPRAYIVKNAAVIVGRHEHGTLTEGKKAMYSLLLDDEFNPEESVLIYALDISNIEIFNATVLSKESLSNDEIRKLRVYYEKGGVIVPDIFGEKPFDRDRIFSNLKGSKYEKVDHIMDTPNKDVINVSGKSGFLVLSEVYSLYDGWKARLDGNEADILRANGVISSVFIPPGSIELELAYEPRSFIIGRNITIATLLVLLTVFTVFFIKRKK